MKFLALLTIVFFSFASGNVQLIKKENNDSNTTLLVIGGIHGNEPGGYFSAAILASHYTITSKNLWVVPNLNKDSIIANKRGIHGDMNRKFHYIKPNDKDKEIVNEIKKIILEKKVSLILNLHDGHGFYREKYQSSIFNPTAWGQTCVIDQCKLNQNQPFGNLNEIAKTVKDKINAKTIEKHHKFNVKNTNTKFDDEDMRQSLTYFAVTHNKPAFAIETSKSLSTVTQKVYYQLLAIEEYMRIMGIKFQRDFKLNAKELKRLINSYGTLEINNNISLDLNQIKKSLNYIPLKPSGNSFSFSNLLGAVKFRHGVYEIYIGNKKITSLRPQHFKISKECPKNYAFVIDGKNFILNKSSVFHVDEYFKVKNIEGCRTNIIGFHQKGLKNEVGVLVSKDKLDQKYSIDTKAKQYRVEFYKGKDFCTMIIANFK